MIQFVVAMTAILLGLGSVLVIVGLFDAFLGWDIFSTGAEAVLYGVLFSLLTLAAAGVALTFLLGMLEVVVLMRSAQQGVPPPERPSVHTMLKFAIAGAGAVGFLVVGLSFVDSRIQDHRNAVFKKLTQDQVARFSDKITDHLPSTSDPPEVDPQLVQAMSTLRGLSLFQYVHLCVMDPSDPDAFWVFRWASQEKPDRFVRMYAAKKHEIAATKALNGDPAALDRYNSESRFNALYRLEHPQRRDAVLYLIGNQHEDLRSY